MRRNRKLSDEQVYEIKNLIVTTDSTNRELADSFRVGISTINNIRTGRTFQRINVPGFVPKSTKDDKVDLNKHLHEITDMINNQHKSFREVATHFNYTAPTIRRYYEKGLKV